MRKGRSLHRVSSLCLRCLSLAVGEVVGSEPLPISEIAINDPTIQGQTMFGRSGVFEIRIRLG